MKNFLKLTATFACLFTIFSACNTDDTVDGYIPVFTAIESETVYVTRGDSRIKVVWDVPDDENITAAKISWSSSVENGSEIVDIQEYQHSTGTYGEDGYVSCPYTYIIGEDDYRIDSKDDFIPLPAGSYTVTIEHMEGKYVGTGGHISDPVFVYNKDYYEAKEDKYPTYESVAHEKTSAATITWTGFPEDCYDVMVKFTIIDEDGEEATDSVVVEPGDFDFDSVDDQTTDLEGAIFGSTITFTVSFLPEGAIGDDIVTIDESTPIDITIDAAIKAEPTIVAEMGGLEKLYVEWFVYNDMGITKTTLQVYDGNTALMDSEIEITFSELVDEGFTDIFVGGYDADAEYNVAYRTIENSDLTTLFTAGKLYTVKLINYIDTTPTEAVVSKDLFVYDDDDENTGDESVTNTYETAPAIFTITHNGESAYIVWDLSGLDGYDGTDEDPDYLAYNALDKIEVTYTTNTAVDYGAGDTTTAVVEFTSDLTTHFTLECELPDAQIGTTYSYEAYFRPASAIQDEDNYASVGVATAEPATIPAPILAAVNGVTIYSGYNDDESSYLQVGWSDVTGGLGSVNDNIEDVYVFYTQDYGRIDAMAGKMEEDCDYGNDYAVAAAAFAGYDSSSETTAPAPISVTKYLSENNITYEDFITDKVEGGCTITISKTNDGTSDEDGYVAVETNKTYYIAVVTKGYRDDVNQNGQFAFTNIDTYNPAEDPAYGATGVDVYVNRDVKTYNKATYTDESGNATIFSVYQPTITRNLTNATLAWQWDKHAKETTDAADVVAVAVTGYSLNVSSGGGTYSGDKIEVYTGESTTLANVKAGTGAIPSGGYIAYFCPASGIEPVEIVQTLALDIPYLVVPIPTLSLKVGINGDRDTDDGEPYIQTTWSVDDTNSENIGGFEIFYQEESGGTYDGTYSSKVVDSGDRTYDIAPDTSGDETVLTADANHGVYISCVDLDGHVRPNSTDTGGATYAADSLKITKTYNFNTYKDDYIQLADDVEELAFDGDIMTVTWGGFGSTAVGNVNNTNKDLKDCVGVVITMTDTGSEFGYEYMLEATTKVSNVETGDKFTYTSYFRPDDGLTIAKGATTTTATWYDSTGGNTTPAELAVPISTAPTMAMMSSIVSTYDDDDVPSITLEWTFDETEDPDSNVDGMDNILEEEGNKYLYIRWYRDDKEGVTATSVASSADTNGGLTKVEIGEGTSISRVATETDNVYKYTYEIPTENLTVDANTTSSYTIYVGTMNINSVEYASATFDEIKTYNSKSYSAADLPEALTVESGINNTIEVTWDVETVFEDLRYVYLTYGGKDSDDFEAETGLAYATYMSGYSTVVLNGKFSPDYDLSMSEYDADYEDKAGIVSHPKKIAIEGTKSYTAEITEYDITYDFEEGVYRIITARGLGAFADLVNGTTTYTGDTTTPIISTGIDDWTQYAAASAMLSADIDLSEICSATNGSWTPIGGSATDDQYKGTFDGDGYTISGLYIDADTDYQGLFGYVNGATISDLKLSAPSIYVESDAGEQYVGAIVGRATTSTISNCHVVGGTIKNINNKAQIVYLYTAGIAGCAETKSTVVDCSNSADIYTTYARGVGGIAGYLTASSIVNSHNSGDITTELLNGILETPVASYNQEIGGVVGGIASSIPSIIVGCSNAGVVMGHKLIGGLVGSIAEATTDGVYIVSSYNTGGLVTTDQYTGGLIGQLPNSTTNKTYIAGCYNTGSVYTYYSSASYSSMPGVWVGGVIGGFNAINYPDDTYLTEIEENYVYYTEPPYTVLNPVKWGVGTRYAYLNETTATYSVSGYNSANRADYVEDYPLFNGRVGDMNEAIQSVYDSSTEFTSDKMYYLDISSTTSAPKLTTTNPGIKSPETLTDIEFETTEQDEVTVSWTYGNGSDGINYVDIYTRPVDSEGAWTKTTVSGGSYDTVLTLEEKTSASYDIYIRTRNLKGGETATEYTADSPYTISVSKDPVGLDLKWFGSAEDNQPFMIYSEDGLKAFADIVNGIFTYDSQLLTVTGDGIVTGLNNSSASAILMADIELTSEWTKIIGTAIATELGSFESTKPYSGTFDGDGYTISGFELSTSSTCQGLFGYIAGATIKDLTLTVESISTSNLYSSALVGVAMAYSTIDNCTVNGTSASFSYQASGVIAGGIIGGSKISNCVNNISVSLSGSYMGAIVGDVRNSTVENSTNNGAITLSGGSYVGGIAGLLTTNSNDTEMKTAVVGCENNADMSGTAGSYIGGVVGQIVNGLGNTEASSAQVYIQNSDNNGDITLTSSGSNIAGILGGASEETNAYQPFKLYASSNYGDVNVSGASSVAGIVGSVTSGYTEIQGDTSLYSYNRGNITGYQYVGGIVGNHAAAAAVSYYNNTGLVTGSLDSDDGQIYGATVNSGRFTNCNDEYTPDDIDIRYLASGVYEISTAKGLHAFAAIVNGSGDPTTTTGVVSYGISNWTQNTAADGVIVADFTASDTEITAMSNYTGTFDGKGHTITGLKVTGKGLFASILEGSVVQNLILHDPTISGGGSCGAFVGTATSATIYNCHVTVSTAGNTIFTSGGAYIGGIVGFIYGGSSSDETIVGEMSIIACSNAGSLVSATTYNTNAAGIVGRVECYNYVPVTIKYCLNTANISTGQYGGGIVGNIHSGSDPTAIAVIIESCTNTGNITAGGTQTGGIAGCGGSNYIYCANSGSITSTSNTVGGIVGQTYNEAYLIGTKPTDYNESDYRIAGTPLESVTLGGNTNTGSISGTGNNYAGILGSASSTTAVSGYNNTVSVYTTGSAVGGIIGTMASGATLFGTTDAHCYNTGAITGSANVGGVVGAHTGAAANISYCDNYGEYTCTSDAAATYGSIVGSGTSYYNVTTCVDYWNTANALTGVSVSSSHVNNGQSTITVSWTYPADKTNLADVAIYYKRDVVGVYSKVVVSDLVTTSYTLDEDEYIINGTTYSIYVVSRNSSGAETESVYSGGSYSSTNPFEVIFDADSN